MSYVARPVVSHLPSRPAAGVAARLLLLLPPLFSCRCADVRMLLPLPRTLAAQLLPPHTTSVPRNSPAVTGPLRARRGPRAALLMARTCWSPPRRAARSAPTRQLQEGQGWGGGGAA